MSILVVCLLAALIVLYVAKRCKNATEDVPYCEPLCLEGGPTLRAGPFGPILFAPLDFVVVYDDTCCPGLYTRTDRICASEYPGDDNVYTIFQYADDFMALLPDDRVCMTVDNLKDLYELYRKEAQCQRN